MKSEFIDFLANDLTGAGGAAAPAANVAAAAAVAAAGVAAGGSVGQEGRALIDFLASSHQWFALGQLGVNEIRARRAMYACNAILRHPDTCMKRERVTFFSRPSHSLSQTAQPQSPPPPLFAHTLISFPEKYGRRTQRRRRWRRRRGRGRRRRWVLLLQPPPAVSEYVQRCQQLWPTHTDWKMNI